MGQLWPKTGDSLGKKCSGQKYVKKPIKQSLKSCTSITKRTIDQSYKNKFKNCQGQGFWKGQEQAQKQGQG